MNYQHVSIYSSIKLSPDDLGVYATKCKMSLCEAFRRQHPLISNKSLLYSYRRNLDDPAQELIIPEGTPAFFIRQSSYDADVRVSKMPISWIGEVVPYKDLVEQDMNDLKSVFLRTSFKFLGAKARASFHRENIKRYRDSDKFAVRLESGEIHPLFSGQQVFKRDKEKNELVHQPITGVVFPVTLPKHFQRLALAS